MKELLTLIALIALLAILTFAQDAWMPSMTTMLLLLGVVILVCLHTLFVWKEHGGDEREHHVRAFGARVAFSLTGAILIIGIIAETLHNYMPSPWLAAALVALVVEKLLVKPTGIHVFSMKKALIAIGLVGVVVILWYSLATPTVEQDAMMATTTDSMMMDDGMESSKMMTYTGDVLVDGPSKIIAFSEHDYENAQHNGDAIILWFYANWCPNCAAEQKALFEAMQAFEEPGVVVFRVNYNDSDTDTIEKQLAKEFGVAYQHTKVVIQGGEVISKSPEVWTSDRAKEALQALVAGR